jgi:transposase-like protein
MADKATCPHINFRKNGKVPGTDIQRYRCKDCGKSFPPSPRKVGKPLISDAPLTDAEKQRRRYIKQHGEPAKTKREAALKGWARRRKKKAEENS